MKRPLEDKRPVGPFVESSMQISARREYDKVEIQINEDHEPYKYTVTGIMQITPESVGLVADTASLMVNGAPLAMWEYEQGRPDEEVIRGQSGMEITAPEGSKVKLTNVSESLIEIEV